MRILRTIHTGYGLVVFAFLFLLFFPFLLIPIIFPKHYYLVGVFNRGWAKMLFILCFLPYRVECRSVLDKRKQYIFCPNHFSYLDIPTLGLNPVNTIFVGKSEMEGIPLFGFMYRKLHITVDRSSLKSKFNTLKRSGDALEEGKSLVIFPEGGMTTDNAPHLSRFKDGAFRVAIEKQISIVPVTIPFNWLILPDTGSMVLHRGTIHLIFHEPVETKGMTLTDVDRLKENVFTTIENELKKYENRY
jgi:1-acyl-sn-glycerol-3-phosphate acyltransferase